MKKRRASELCWKNSFASERHGWLAGWRPIPGFAGFNVCIFCQTWIWKSASQSWRLMPNLYWNSSNLKQLTFEMKCYKHSFDLQFLCVILWCVLGSSLILHLCIFAFVCVCICICVCISRSCPSFPWLGYLSLCLRPPAASLNIFIICDHVKLIFFQNEEKR